MDLFQKPQVTLARSTPDRMRIVAVCCFLAVLQSSLSDSYRSLLVALAAAAGAVLIELLFNLREKHFSLGDTSAVASALVLAVFLPNRINPLLAFLGAAFAMAVIKHSFGGLGSNWVNPAAGAWLFIRAAWPVYFSGSLEGSHLVRLQAAVERGLQDSQGAPLTMLKINGWPGIPLDTTLSGFLNGTFFSLTGTQLPQGYITFFSPPGPGIIADRGLFFLVLGTILLASSQSFRFWVPVFFLAVYSFLVRIFGALPFGGTLGNGDILFGLLSGGVLAAAFILATDPSTGPKSMPGYLVFILFTAGFAFLFRYPGNDPYGCVPAILAGNALVPLIRRIENALYYERRRRG